MSGFSLNELLQPLQSVDDVEFDSNSADKLTTLEGAPREVGGKFNCINNPVEFTYENIADAMKKSRERNTTKLESFKQFFTEACWKNYKQVGMKKKGKKKVPNCAKK